jgi:hypothetical protein
MAATAPSAKRRRPGPERCVAPAHTARKCRNVMPPVRLRLCLRAAPTHRQGGSRGCCLTCACTTWRFSAASARPGAQVARRAVLTERRAHIVPRAAVRRWWLALAEDISGGTERLPVPAINAVDAHILPLAPCPCTLADTTHSRRGACLPVYLATDELAQRLSDGRCCCELCEVADGRTARCRRRPPIAQRASAQLRPSGGRSEGQGVCAVPWCVLSGGVKRSAQASGAEFAPAADELQLEGCACASECRPSTCQCSLTKMNGSGFAYRLAAVGSAGDKSGVRVVPVLRRIVDRPERHACAPTPPRAGLCLTTRPSVPQRGRRPDRGGGPSHLRMQLSVPVRNQLRQPDVAGGARPRRCPPRLTLCCAAGGAVQRPPTHGLYLVRTADRGWGVKSAATIAKGEFVCLYTGSLGRPADRHAQQRNVGCGRRNAVCRRGQPPPGVLQSVGLAPHLPLHVHREHICRGYVQRIACRGLTNRARCSRGRSANAVR